MIGVLPGSSLATPRGPVITRQLRLQGISVGHRDRFEAMLWASEQHRVPVIVDRVSEFPALKEALAYLKSGARFGKICIPPSSDRPGRPEGFDDPLHPPVANRTLR
ncbi:MAG: hypothetical protein V5B39_11965 [Accumulibacter sp.]|jgi:D-arabinose 1-dehydrogenase-like Zn-dependent alcohol dehydrogenase|uniref:hypothetical protein n=1 Tax=Accumulibacter sp. TaxID=2053492 RepID=UPI002FC2E420